MEGPSVDVVDRVCYNIAETTFENFDSKTVDLAKKRILDILGCIIGGVNAPGNAALEGLVRKWGGREESTIFVKGGKAPAQNVAMLNSIFARSYDFEVMSYVIDGKLYASHHAATVVPTALALGELLRSSGREILTAMLVGEDLAARVQTASAEHPIYLGWDGCATLSHLAATATAARLLRLSPSKVRNALGIVLNMIAGAIQSLWDGATTFKLGQGLAARNGIFAAELAEQGWIGVKDPLMSRFGYFSLYGGGCKDPSVLTKDLGVRYYGETYFKPYPCGLPTHVAINCTLSLIKGHDPDVENIEEISIGVPPGALQNSYYAKPFIIRDFPHGDAIFSYPYAVVTTLLKKKVGLANFTEEAILDHRVSKLIDKTKLLEQTAAGDRLSIELRVKMKDGRELVERCAFQMEWVERTTSWEFVINKFWHQVDFSAAVSKKDADKIINLVGDFENVSDISEMVSFLRGQKEG
jgi:2-methylcitrate dehydratase PrpD